MKNTADANVVENGIVEGISLFKANVNGIDVNFAKVGQGPAIILVHGLTNNWFGWGRVIEFLKDDFTLYIPDLLGYGHSGDFNGDYSLQQQAQFISDFIDTLEIKPVAVMGVSMGSLVTAEVGKLIGDRLKSVILVSPLLHPARHSYLKVFFWRQLNKLMLKRDFLMRAYKRFIATRFMSHSLSFFLNMCRYDFKLVEKYGFVGKRLMRTKTYLQMSLSVSLYDLREFLQIYTDNILLIYGKCDRVARPRHAYDIVASKADTMNIVEIDSAGHWVQVEKPEELSNAVKKYLTAILSND